MLRGCVSWRTAPRDVLPDPQLIGLRSDHGPILDQIPVDSGGIVQSTGGRTPLSWNGSLAGQR